MTVGVDEMPAGIELDILVAEALGYVRTPITIGAEGIATETKGPIFIVVRGVSLVGDDRVYIRQTISGKFTRFAPSTDIAAAWEVVNWLHDQKIYITLDHENTGPEWYCIITNDLGIWPNPLAEAPVYFEATTNSAPLAICRSALKLAEYMEGK